MSLYIKLFLLLTGLFLFSFNSKENIGENETVNCLKLDMEAGDDVTFNEKWLVENKVKKIIESFYTSEDDGEDRIIGISVSHYDENGYIISKYEKSYLRDTFLLKEEDIKSKYNYLYEKSDSLLIQHTETISYYNARYEFKLPMPDTAKHNFTKTYKLKPVSSDKYEYRLISRAPFIYNGRELYKYDDKGRLITTLNGAEAEYLDDNTIRIKKDLNPYGAMPQIGFVFLKTNENGQITERRVQHFLRNEHTTVFKYNKAGEMIKREKLVNGQETKVANSRYTTYSYHK